MDEPLLARARLHVQRGEIIVAQQETIVASLRLQGIDTAAAERLLDTFRVSLAMMRESLAHEERAELAYQRPATTAEPGIFRWDFQCADKLTWTCRAIGADEGASMSRHFPSLQAAMTHAGSLGFDPERDHWTMRRNGRITIHEPGGQMVNRPDTDSPWPGSGTDA